jgi:DNA-binding winged helix-turn-helix (wHTH) protein
MSASFRFGEFELDTAAYALSRAGERIRLEKMPMELLILLVARAGTLLDRRDIRASLWGSHVFVEHDSATNTAVRKIRQALGDDADKPRFVETVVGKGYRFIAPVEGRTHGRRAMPSPPVTAAAASRTILPAAYDAYVRGRHALDKRGESDLDAAVRFFRQSIDADPTYAPAYAGMADGYGQLGYGSYISPEDAFPRARAAARKAIELDPLLAEAHASLGYALMYYDWNFSGAEAEFKRAIELNPNNAVAHQWYAYLLTAMERPLSDAEREIGVARSLDPLSVPIHIDRAYILHYYGRNDDALESVRLALEMNPKYAPAYFWLGRIYTSERRYAEAEAALQKIGPLRTWTPAMAVLGYLHAKSGRLHDASTVLAEFDELVRQRRYASGYAIAVIYAGLGDRERVFSYLDAAFRERSHWLVWLKRDPRWNECRSDVRFQNLVRRVGLP